MAATVAMTGQGGWPMTCFLTPTVSRSTAAPTSRPRRRGAARVRRTARRHHTDLGTEPRRGRPDCRAGACPPRPDRGGAAGRRNTVDDDLGPLGNHRLDRRRGPDKRRLGTRSEVPAVGDDVGSPRHDERVGSPEARAVVERTAIANGPRRDLRPVGRWFRPLCRRRGVGGAALREDALRQRPVAPCVRATAPRDGPVRESWRAACEQTVAFLDEVLVRPTGSHPHSTPTPTAWKARPTRGPPPNSSRCSARMTAVGP